jgi:hypothetical protein
MYVGIAQVSFLWFVLYFRFVASCCLHSTPRPTIHLFACATVNALSSAPNRCFVMTLQKGDAVRFPIILFILFALWLLLALTLYTLPHHSSLRMCHRQRSLVGAQPLLRYDAAEGQRGTLSYYIVCVVAASRALSAFPPHPTRLHVRARVMSDWPCYSFF